MRTISIGGIPSTHLGSSGNMYFLYVPVVHLDLRSEFLNLIGLDIPWTLVGCISLYTSQSIPWLHKTWHLPSPITIDSTWVIVPCHHHIPLPSSGVQVGSSSHSEAEGPATPNSIQKQLWSATLCSSQATWAVHLYNIRELKQVVQMEPALLQPNQKKPFKVEIDTSNYAISAVLMQKDNKGILHHVAFFSKSLNLAQRNYTVYNWELLALVETCRHYRQYMHQPAHTVKIHTDHANLLYWKNPEEHNRRVARWHAELMVYDFSLVHISEEKNGHTNALSRHPDHDTGQEDNKKLVVLPEQLFANTHARKEWWLDWAIKSINPPRIWWLLHFPCTIHTLWQINIGSVLFLYPPSFPFMCRTAVYLSFVLISCLPLVYWTTTTLGSLLLVPVAQHC